MHRGYWRPINFRVKENLKKFPCIFCNPGREVAGMKKTEASRLTYFPCCCVNVVLYVSIRSNADQSREKYAIKTKVCVLLIIMD